MDPVDVRRKNLHAPFDEATAFICGLSVDSGDYLPAFSTGMAFNLVNLAVLLFLLSRPHTRLMRQPQTST